MSAARFATAVLAALMLGAAATHAQTAFSPAPWLGDLDQLRDGMSTGYANLEWQVGRGLDLPATEARARARILAAHDDDEARRAFERFLAAFGDGHLEVRWPTAVAATAPTRSAATEPLCARLGYFDLRDDGGPALRLPGAKPVGAQGAHLKAAVAKVGQHKIAVLRVGMFSPQGYSAICDDIAAQRGLTAASPCDDACKEVFEQATEAAFVGEMVQQVRALAAARPDVLLIDITGNGGGNSSSLALARIVTRKPLKRAHGGGLMGPSWAKELGEREADLAKALATAAPADRPALERFGTALVKARTEALKTCDRAPLWSGRPIACTALSPEPLYEGFWSSVPKADDPVAHAKTAWTGPLIVLVDGDSASSSEWFAAMLQDTRAATILGSPTAGAGCGHITEAEPIKLTHSGGMVLMPDCWRLRANGDNEADGVQPDVLIGFRAHDSLAQKTQRLVRALPQALASAAGRR